MRKPITPKMHGIMDYAIGSALLTLPAKVGVNPKVANNYRKLAAGYASLNAMTDCPTGVRKMIPLKVHRAMDIALLGGLAIATATKAVRSDKKTMIFHCALLGVAATQFFLTDFSRPKNLVPAMG